MREISSKALTGADFSEALAALQEGKKVYRRGWLTGDEYVFLAHAIEFDTDAYIFADVEDLQNEYGPHTYIGELLIYKDILGKLHPGWLPSHEDLFAKDWYIVC